MGTGNILGIFESQLGLVPRVAQKMFEYVAQASSDKREFTLKATFVELYNEEFKDLFDPIAKQIVMREDKQEGVILLGPTEKAVQSFEEMMSLLEVGSLQRTTHSTSMNEVSSRSHAIFSLRIEQRMLEAGNGVPETVNDLDLMVSKFHFVDLAGSERLKRTQAEGDRLKEGISINSGLLALGNVISALGDPTRKASHVPYRDSRLTRLLQDSLGGNSRTLMVACVSPADSNFNETLSTLRYANRARNIKNHAIINRDPTAVLIAQLRKEVADLTIQLKILRGEEAPRTLVDQAESDRLHSEIQSLQGRNMRLRATIRTLTQERDCFALKLKATGQDDILQEAKEEFMDQVSKSVESNPDTESPRDIERQPSKADKEQLKTKMMMMRSLMSREQQQRLQKMEAAAYLPPSAGTVPLVGTTKDPEVESVRSSAVSSDVFDTSDLVSQDQIVHEMNVKLLDDQFNALSSNIDIKNDVIGTFLEKVNRYQDLQDEADVELHSAEAELHSTQLRIDEVDKFLNSVDILAEDRDRYLGQRAELQHDIRGIQKRLEKAELDKKRIVMLKVESDRKVEQLKNEVKLMKEQKVALNRRIKDENANWKRFKMDQKQEMARLKQKLHEAEGKYLRVIIDAKKSADVLAVDSRRLSTRIITSTSPTSTSEKRKSQAIERSENRKTVKLNLPSERAVPDRGTSSSPDRRITTATGFLKWMQTGISQIVEDRALQRGLAEQEASVRLLEERLETLRSALEQQKAQGFLVQVDIEDKLDMINAELEYRKHKVEETKQMMANEEIPVNFENLAIQEARAIAKIAIEELVESRVAIDEQRGEIEGLCEDLGEAQASVARLEGQIPLQELKMQHRQAELEAQHEKQLWYFMNKIEVLKKGLVRYESRMAQQQQAGRQEQIEEQEGMWNSLNEVELLREQRYEDLLARNDYLSHLVAEQSNLTSNLSETRELLSKSASVFSSLLSALTTIQQQGHIREDVPHPEKDRPRAMSDATKGSIFKRLSDANSFTGMYKVIHEDMNERGIGHLGGTKLERKQKKPKQEARNKHLLDTGRLVGHTSAVFKVVSQGNRVFTCSMDSTSRMWDIEVQKSIALFEDHKAPVRSILVKDDLLVSVSEDKTMKFWDVRLGSCISTVILDYPSLSLVAGLPGEFFAGHEGCCSVPVFFCCTQSRRWEHHSLGPFKFVEAHGPCTKANR
eukprot:c20667_g1_i4.p1 GENE.c20667_g1_i4~~c20667_g1_i4.p1  ORF type:complete len:1198 (-),score=245.03 c20667_g1_i4:1549-5142(-)